MGGEAKMRGHQILAKDSLTKNASPDGREDGIDNSQKLRDACTAHPQLKVARDVYCTSLEFFVNDNIGAGAACTLKDVQ